jgi:hypothetical protein
VQSSGFSYARATNRVKLQKLQSLLLYNRNSASEIATCKRIRNPIYLFDTHVHWTTFFLNDEVCGGGGQGQLRSRAIRSGGQPATVLEHSGSGVDQGRLRSWGFDPEDSCLGSPLSQPPWSIAEENANDRRWSTAGRYGVEAERHSAAASGVSCYRRCHQAHQRDSSLGLRPRGRISPGPDHGRAGRLLAEEGNLHLYQTLWTDRLSRSSTSPAASAAEGSISFPVSRAREEEDLRRSPAAVLEQGAIGASR